MIIKRQKSFSLFGKTVKEKAESVKNPYVLPEDYKVYQQASNNLQTHKFRSTEFFKNNPFSASYPNIVVVPEDKVDKTKSKTGAIIYLDNDDSYGSALGYDFDNKTWYIDHWNQNKIKPVGDINSHISSIYKKTSSPYTSDNATVTYFDSETKKPVKRNVKDVMSAEEYALLKDYINKQDPSKFKKN